MKYADLVIDNKSSSTDLLYTYGCEDDSVHVGQKVRVLFARGKTLRDAYVFRVTDRPEREFRNLKYISEIDGDIELSREIIDTCVWMRKRYLIRYIDAVKCFTPSGGPSKRGKRRGPLENEEGEPQDIKRLTDDQRHAAVEINRALNAEKHELFLLHGVTGSGKTEVYMQAIATCIKAGRTAIMMVPEISLTRQIIDRFIGRFGSENIAVLHSRLSQGERYDEWKRIREGKARIVIGARSAVFAPLSDIGVIIMDEEHEATYKSDMTPRYDTAEVAIKRARAYGAAVIMGSATPSVTTYQRSREGIFRLLSLKKRYNEVDLPEVSVVDMRAELKAGNRSVLSREMYSTMKETLEAGKQVILFLNRRGYSTFVSCRECGYVLKCPDCGISLTYHRDTDSMVCHYCGRTEKVPQVCPECGSRYIRFFGAGTEKIEDEVTKLFGEYTTGRLDLDTMKKKGSLEKILDDFGSGRTDILTGTQVVAKGLDFRNVGLAGIVSADSTLNIPDYRSAERTFQLVTQAAGRAGRGSEKGKVVIQTYRPDDYAVRAAAAQDYSQFFSKEIRIRQAAGYPPFSDFIQIIFSSESENVLKECISSWHRQLEEKLADAASNIYPAGKTAAASGGKVFRGYLLIRAPRGSRAGYMDMIGRIRACDSYGKKCMTVVDVNPYSIWRI